MVAKLAVCILTLGFTGVSVLVLRQERLLVIDGMTDAVNNAQDRAEQVWTLRAEIARRTTPQAIQAMALDRAGEWGPLVPIEAPVPDTDEPLVVPRTWPAWEPDR